MAHDARKTRTRIGASLAALVVLAVVAAAASPSEAGGAADAGAGGATLDCMKSWGEARYAAMAYNHVVHLASSCGAPAKCDVSTNVNPEVQHVVVPPGAHVEVVTFIGSPASTFVPRVRCTL